jgi:hypothetical protein
VITKGFRVEGIAGILFMLVSITGAAQTGAAGVAAPFATESTPASASATSSAKGNSSSAAVSAVESPQRVQRKTSTSKDRLFWTLPNFLTVENAHKIPPLTAKQKFKVVLRSTFDRAEYPYIAFLAGISQAADGEPGFGQGAAGYAKRYGAAFADNTIENFTTGAVLPSLLHQDPRYYQLGHGSFTHRFGYAISRIFVTRSDAGNSEFNASEVLGSAATAAIATYSYHPVEDRTFSNTISVWGTQVGWDAVALTVKEFWPDIRRKVQKRHQVGRLAPSGNSQQDSER